MGVGAGFDKDGVALRGWEALGLGFIEVGTVTPLAQGGNPRPRLFRLTDDEALINRMGFNNAGAAALARNVMLARRHLPAGFASASTSVAGRRRRRTQATADYLEAFGWSRRWPTTSPSTSARRTRPACATCSSRTAAQLLGCAPPASANASRPLLVKLAPDLETDAFEALIAVAAEHAQGVILSNTTVAATGWHPQRNETGGLRAAAAGSDAGGRGARTCADAPPERDRRLGRHRLGGGRGGRLSAGADLVQLWTGLVYRGPGLIGEAVAVRAE